MTHPRAQAEPSARSPRRAAGSRLYDLVMVGSMLAGGALLALWVWQLPR